MLKDLNLTSAILVALLAVPVLLVACMDPIAEWLDAREERKKAKSAAAAASSSTVASSATSPPGVVASSPAGASAAEPA